MSVFYNTLVVCELSPGAKPHAEVRHLIRERLDINLEVSFRRLPYFSGGDRGWVVSRGERRFQLFRFDICTSGGGLLGEFEKEFHTCYARFVELLAKRTRALLIMGDTNRSPFEGLVDAPARMAWWRPRPPEAGATYESHGLHPDSLARLSPEEQDVVASSWRYAIDSLAQNRLADLRGWLVYLGRPLVEAYGRERLRKGPFFRVTRGPWLGLFLHLTPGLSGGYPSPEAWKNRTSIQEQRRYLGIDLSWLDRYREVTDKLRVPLPPEDPSPASSETP